MPHRLLSLLALSLFFRQSAPITDTITPTQPLKDGQILTSGEGNNFALGFFSPGNSTGRRYLGIWYNKISLRTVVWVANRDQPVNGSDGILSIANDGNLVISSHNSTVWSTNISYNRGHTSGDVAKKAQLLDSGNFILVSGGAKQTAVWQSFDYPTQVFLAGMKFGLDLRTGLKRFVNSWRSPNDPGHGRYSYQMVSEGSPEIFLIRDGSVPVWRSGPWVGQKFSGIPTETRSYILDYSFVDNPDEVYFTYKTINSSLVSIFVVDGESGTLQMQTWLQGSRQWVKFWAAPQDDCDSYANCGAFGLCNPSWGLFECSCFPGYQPTSPREWYLRDASGGCTRARNVSMCRNGEGFLKLASVKLPNTSRAKVNMSMSLEECREECLKNCSCSAFTSAIDDRGGGASGGLGGCMVYHGDLIDTREYDAGMGQDLYVRVDKVELAKSLEKSKDHPNKKQLVIILLCVTTTFTLVTSFACWFHRKKRREWKEQEEALLWLGEAEESDSNSDLPVVLQLSTIVAATENFSPMNKLGEGGFGPVYKGKLSCGQDIAVKRLAKNSGQGIHEFKNEVRLIAKLQHKNLVKTLGCCVRGEEKMLIYEFLPNKSLDKYIFDKEKSALLDWSKRFDIILGIARGVLYLHQDSRLKIIHRDLKTSNILLDATMTPKISDFGLARIFGNDQIEAKTNRVVGTFGYMSPEYAMEGHFSIKSDVFSFGVILLEIISGQKNSRYYDDHLSSNLIGYVWKLWHDGNAVKIVDESILSTISGFEDEILRCIQIGLLCVQSKPNERPTMLEVVFMLSNKSELPSPKSAFIVEGNIGDPKSSSTGAYSGNELTVTMVEAR